MKINQGAGWDRNQITLRLTPARKRMLRALAERESMLGSPGDVLDRAVELAIELPDRPALDLQIVHDALAAMDAEARVEAARSSSRLSAVEAALDRLIALISSLGDD